MSALIDSRSMLANFVASANASPAETERLLRRLKQLDAVSRPCPCCVYRGRQQCEVDPYLRGVCRQCWKKLQHEIKTGKATESQLVACGLLEESE